MFRNCQTKAKPLCRETSMSPYRRGLKYSACHYRYPTQKRHIDLDNERINERIIEWLNKKKSKYMNE